VSENFLSREQKQRVPFCCEFASCRGVKGDQGELHGFEHSNNNS
jgi:hypothetical protein